MPSDLPATLINYNLYANAATVPLLGVVNATMPNLAYMVDRFRVAGYGGEIDLPVIGEFSNLRMSVKFTVLWTDSLPLIAPTGLSLTFRAAEESIAISNNGLNVYPTRVNVQAYPLNYNVGTAEVGQQMGSTFEASCRYVAVYHGSVEQLVIDQAGLVCAVDGHDYLEQVRNYI